MDSASPAGGAARPMADEVRAVDQAHGAAGILDFDRNSIFCHVHRPPFSPDRSVATIQPTLEASPDRRTPGTRRLVYPSRVRDAGWVGLTQTKSGASRFRIDRHRDGGRLPSGTRSASPLDFCGSIAHPLSPIPPLIPPMRRI